jgi:hypothetical protein
MKTSALFLLGLGLTAPLTKGNATYTIPKDGKVSVKYINPSPIPHSLLVVEKDSLKKIQMPEPYFKAAAVADLLKGLAYGTSTFTFVADEAGDYALACGFRPMP